MITLLEEGLYETEFRGRIFTLQSHPAGGWCMWTKPVNGRSSPPKYFDSLDDVEKKYKHWKGISKLI
jgi:hypothetical protein